MKYMHSQFLVAALLMLNLQVGIAMAVESASSIVQIHQNLPLNRDPISSSIPLSVWILLGGLIVFFIATRVYIHRGKFNNFRQGSKNFWWRKWIPSVDSSQKIKIISQAALTPRASLHLVEWNGKMMLISCTDTSVSVLKEQDIQLPLKKTGDH